MNFVNIVKSEGDGRLIIKIQNKYEEVLAIAGISLTDGNIGYFETYKDRPRLDSSVVILQHLLDSYPTLNKMSVDSMNIPMIKIALKLGFRVVSTEALEGSVENVVYLNMMKLKPFNERIDRTRFERML